MPAETPGPEDETRPVQAPEAGPDDGARRVEEPEAVHDEEARPADRPARSRRLRDHDPSIIPGLTDDDEIGRSDR